MAREFKRPDLGEGVHEGQVVRVLVKQGEQVVEDQPLMEVETDKAAVEIPSPYAGPIEKVHVEENQIVNVGDVMVTFGAIESAKDDAPVSQGAASKQAEGSGSSSTATATPTAAPPTQGNGSATTTARTGRITPASPFVRKLARQKGLDINTIDGSGPSGRVTRADVEAAAAASGSGGAAPTETQQRPAQAETFKRPQPAASPPPQRAATPYTTGELPQGADDTDAHGNIRRVPLSMARKTIAQNMAHSVATIPHVTDSDDADITDLETFRRGYVFEDDPNRKLRLLPFAIRAVVRAVQRYPLFNASFDHEKNEIIYKRYINIAIGVQTERGLVAPVIRGADQMHVVDIALALDELAHKARTGGFAVEDMRGATFTISNAGAMGGSRYSTPIVSHPQVAVIALGRSRTQPWMVDDEMVPRVIQPLSLSFDHRIIDGAEEIAFMQSMITDLENPARLVL